jgi:hypothetical protein
MIHQKIIIFRVEILVFFVVEFKDAVLIYNLNTNMISLLIHLMTINVVIGYFHVCVLTYSNLLLRLRFNTVVQLRIKSVLLRYSTCSRNLKRQHFIFLSLQVFILVWFRLVQSRLVHSPISIGPVPFGPTTKYRFVQNRSVQCVSSCPIGPVSIGPIPIGPWWRFLGFSNLTFIY